MPASASRFAAWAGIAAVAALVVAVPATPVRAITSERIHQQQSKIEAVHQRIRNKRAQLHFEELREADVRRQLGETAAAMSAAQARLSAVQQRIDAATGTERKEQRLLAAARAALQRQRDAYSRRIVEMYESPADDRLAVLLGTRSLVDLTERWDDLRFVVATDQRLVRERDAAASAVDRLERELAATIVQLDAQRSTSAQTRDQLAALAQERGNLLAVTASDRTHVAAEVQELEEISAQEEAELEALVRAQEAEAERERAQAGQPEAPPPAQGAMQWPVSGPITSPFGMRLNPFGGGNTEFHPGIDIAVPVGTTVAAAAAGRVIIAGWVSGYGNYIAIDHGGGISSGYGHLSSFFVSVGQDVQRGQAIGASGNTGRSTGPHLIFEVRRNGTPVDPNPYL